MNEIPAKDWAELLFYNPRTGRLFWRPRAEEKDRRDKRWNSMFAGKEAGTPCLGYRYLFYNGRKYLAHRVIWAIAYGEYPRFFIDHINGKRSDNRLANLRDVTRGENQKNMTLPKNNKSGVMGVSWYSKEKKWVAEISTGRVAGKRNSVRLGRFDDKNDAIAARKAAEIALGYHPNHGRHAP
jgi:hypothetical protein